MAFAEKIRSLASVTGPLDALLGAAGESGKAWRPVVPDHERAHVVPNDRRPDPDDPGAVRSVGVIGGGTAGYLTALALRAKLPWLDVTLVESSRIPVIGVGEATTPPLLAFLHHYLGIDPHDFQAKVQPSWKLGIRFDGWGPHPNGYTAPFDWGENSVGVLGSLTAQGDPNAFTLQSLFMLADKVPVFEVGGRQLSMMDSIPFAYHLENRRLVRYLTDLAEERGIHHLDAEIAHVELDRDEWVRTLHTKDGQRLEFDLYVDCTGFRSLLLGGALGTEFLSYADSLFTDTAITGYRPQPDVVEPYTRADCMDAGWCWNIPVPDEDHVGYVHSSSFLSEDQAADELLRHHKGVDNLKTVRFRVGRHRKMWRGNVIAIGNSYGFVEPLESSALLMLTFTIMALMPLVPRSWREPTAAEALNQVTAERWDGLRWFLALHYKFNERRDNEFWRAVRETVNVEGARPLLDVFASGAPLHLRDPFTRRLVRAAAPTFYELDGVDCVLLGLGAPHRLMRTGEPLDDWKARKQAADLLVSSALSHRAGLAAFRTNPALLDELVTSPSSWLARYGSERWLLATNA